MAMDQAIKDFAKQFSYEPVVEYSESLPKKSKFLVMGMGGSHQAADILKSWDPSLSIATRSNYGIPQTDLKDTLIIASSYSGNTEEPIDGYIEARDKKLPLAVMAIGGKLLELAKKDKTPYIQIPDTNIQPRAALGFSIKAMLKLMDLQQGLDESSKLSDILKPESLEAQGKKLAQEFKGLIPVIYASARNYSLASIWKIKLNETGKIPSFFNVVPEVNHNEMTGFDVVVGTKALSKNIGFIIIKDPVDHPLIQKRMDVMTKLYTDRGLKVNLLDLKDTSSLEKIFSSLLVGDWFAYHTGTQYGAETEQVPMVEEFKKLIA
jgi:glucose/mannose-6-phosphate isomerase